MRQVGPVLTGHAPSELRFQRMNSTGDLSTMVFSFVSFINNDTLPLYGV